MTEPTAKVVSRAALLVALATLLAVGCSDAPEAARETTPDPTLPVPAAATPPPRAPAGEYDEAALLAKAHEYTDLFFRGEINKLFAAFTPELRAQISATQLEKIHEFVGEHFGKQVEVLDEKTGINENYRGFIRWARFDATSKIIEIRWSLRREDDKISEFWIQPTGSMSSSEGAP